MIERSTDLKPIFDVYYRVIDQLKKILLNPLLYFFCPRKHFNRLYVPMAKMSGKMDFLCSKSVCRRLNVSRVEPELNVSRVGPELNVSRVEPELNVSRVGPELI